MQALKLLLCTAWIALPLVADAAGTAQWSSEHHYTRGDRVWFGDVLYDQYTCNRDECFGDGANALGHGNAWKLDDLRQRSERVDGLLAR